MVLLAFLGFFNVYSLRVNLSVAIVAMTENRTVITENGTETWEQDFPWNSKQKGLILSSFFYGYILTQLAGGFVGAKIGGNIVSKLTRWTSVRNIYTQIYFQVFGVGIGATAILTLFTPMAAKHSLEMFLFVRIVEGIFEVSFKIS